MTIDQLEERLREIYQRMDRALEFGRGYKDALMNGVDDLHELVSSMERERIVTSRR